MKKTLFVDMMTGIVLMLVSAYWFIEASRMMKVDLGIGPGGYPMFVSAGLFLMGLILTIKSIKNGLPKPEGKIDWKVTKRIAIFVVASFFYVWAMRYLGFILLTPFFIFFACWFFQYKRKIVAAITSIAVTAVLFVVFRHFFFVPLPDFRLF